MYQNTLFLFLFFQKVFFEKVLKKNNLISMLNLVLIGAGNLGFNFYNEFSKNKKINLIQWYSRSLNTVKFAKKNTSIIDDIKNIKKADLYIVCVNDDSIKNIIKQINLKGLIVHTSGFCSIKEIDSKKRRGVFYPVQTFIKSRKISFKNIPICIEAEDRKDLKKLIQLSNYINAKAYEINSEKRKVIHLAAVFVNNFSNHLYSIAQELLDSNKISFNIFHSIIRETTEKVLEIGPEKSQTGPAKRGDKKTIEEHEKFLTNKEYKKLYLIITQLIEKKYESRKL